MVVVFADFGKAAYLYNFKSLLQPSLAHCLAEAVFFQRNNEEVAVDLFVSLYFFLTSRTIEL